jgi:EXS family
MLPREFDRHCLNYARLKARLVDDPPDAFDDHPTLAEVESDTAAPTATDFSDPRTRVFVYELGLELTRLSEFYLEQCRACDTAQQSLQNDADQFQRQEQRQLRPLRRSRSAVNASEVDLAPLQQKTRLAEVIGKHGEDRARGGRRRANATTSDESRTAASESPRVLHTAADSITEAGYDSDDSNSSSSRSSRPVSKHQLKADAAALSDAVHALVTFRMLNHDACCRLAAAHAEQLHPALPEHSAGAAAAVAAARQAAAAAVLQRLQARAAVFDARHLQPTAAALEQLYAQAFCHGDAAVARAALSHRTASALYSSGSVVTRRFALGLRIGAAGVLLLWAAWDCLFSSNSGASLSMKGDIPLPSIWHDPAFKIYRGLGNVILLVWCWGGCLAVWRKYGVDYVQCLSMQQTGRYTHNTYAYIVTLLLRGIVELMQDHMRHSTAVAHYAYVYIWYGSMGSVAYYAYVYIWYSNTAS